MNKSEHLIETALKIALEHRIVFSQHQQMKAKKYILENRVRLIPKDNTIVGLVHGSAPKPYRLKIPLNEGKPRLQHATCSCPALRGCTHLLATLTVYLMQTDETQNTLSKSVPSNSPAPGDFSDCNMPNNFNVLQPHRFFLRSQTIPNQKAETRWRLFPALRVVAGSPLARGLVSAMVYQISLDRKELNVQSYSPNLPNVEIEPALHRFAEWMNLRKNEELSWAEFWAGATSQELAALRNTLGQKIYVAGSCQLEAVVTKPKIENWKEQPLTLPLDFYASFEGKKHLLNTCFWEAGKLWYLGESILAYSQAELSYQTALYRLIHQKSFTLEDLHQLQKELGTMANPPLALKSVPQSLSVIHPPSQLIWHLKSWGKGGLLVGFETTQFEETTKPKARRDSPHWVLKRPREVIHHDFVTKALTLIQSWGLACSAHVGSHPYTHHISGLTLGGFLTKHSRVLLDAGMGLSIDKGRPIHSTSKIQFRITSGIDWFDIEVEGLPQAITPNSSPIKLGEGWIQFGEYLIQANEADQETLARLSRLKTYSHGKLQINKLNFSLIEELFEQRELPDDVKVWIQLGQMLRNGATLEPIEAPKNFQGVLRAYQGTGLHWLCYLDKHGLNGCLADDMGLGKTVQTLAFLAHRLMNNPTGNRFLIVAPVTTLPNWQSEAGRFLPNLNVRRHHGAQHDQDEASWPNDVLILVSYTTLRNNIAFFQRLHWDVVILDEAQAIKNPASLSFKAVSLLKANRRLTLTGTPIENNIGDLFAQMEFLNPGLLGHQSTFRSRFQNNHEQLRTLCAPFILRRKKTDVLPDLPTKSEVILRCEMEEDQAVFYEALKNEFRFQMINLQHSQNVSEVRFIFLAALLRLRQSCLFPVLANPAKGKISSAKMSTLMKILQEILHHDNKVLIFSQFTQALELIGEQLETRHISYLYLDGATQDRESLIAQFQKPETEKVFLLSLKAGGVGINLTAANYVIIFDPWWNPAVESQAIDRAHRIGQKRPVTVYRLVVSNTVEEKILNLQEIKKDLSKNLIINEKDAFKTMSDEEALALLE